jgi:protein-histidine pros-kinase
MKRAPDRFALILMIAGLLGLIALAGAERRTLQTVIDITNARKATRDTVIVAREVDAFMQALERAHTDVLLGDAPQEFQTADARLADARNALVASGDRLDDLAFPIAGVTNAVANLRTLLDADLPRGAAPDLAGVADRRAASASQVRSAQVVIERLVQALYDRIDTYDAAVVDRQREASLLRWSMGLLLPLLLSGAYLLMWREARRRQHAEERLRDSHQALEGIVAARTAELEASRRDLLALAASQDEGIEDERRRLAREVHDQLGQILTALKLRVQRWLPRDPEFRYYDRLLDDAIATTRRIAADLRPPLLDDLGLAAALGQLVRRDDLAASVRVDDDHLLTPRQAEQLFRIAQEAVTNVQRHARATRIDVQGSVAEQDYVLAVQDDGMGFDAANVRPGALGLISMRERAHAAGGQCRWFADAHGTRVEIRLPLAERQAA